MTNDKPLLIITSDNKLKFERYDSQPNEFVKDRVIEVFKEQTENYPDTNLVTETIEQFSTAWDTLQEPLDGFLGFRVSVPSIQGDFRINKKYHPEIAITVGWEMIQQHKPDYVFDVREQFLEDYLIYLEDGDIDPLEAPFDEWYPNYIDMESWLNDDLTCYFKNYFGDIIRIETSRGRWIIIDIYNSNDLNQVIEYSMNSYDDYLHIPAKCIDTIVESLDGAHFENDQDFDENREFYELLLKIIIIDNERSGYDARAAFGPSCYSPSISGDFYYSRNYTEFLQLYLDEYGYKDDLDSIDLEFYKQHKTEEYDMAYYVFTLLFEASSQKADEIEEHYSKQFEN